MKAKRMKTVKAWAVVDSKTGCLLFDAFGAPYDELRRSCPYHGEENGE